MQVLVVETHKRELDPFEFTLGHTLFGWPKA